MLKRMVIAATALVVLGGAAAWTAARAGPGDNAPAPPTRPAVTPDPIGDLIVRSASCDAPGFEAAASANATSVERLSWSPFGRAEQGWAIYAPMIAKEVGSACAVDTPGFAADLAAWQEAKGLSADGRMSAATFAPMKEEWQAARPFVAVRAEGVCPDAPREAGLVTLSPDEGYLGKRVQLRADVAEAYRAMVAAARAEDPAIAGDIEALDVFSGFRSPEYDAARCARDHNCGGVVRASCSAHRTGYAFDLVVGHTPGKPVDSTDDDNRRYMTGTAAYHWLVANAGRFGFVNYVFEPWHWEYRGEPSGQGAVQASAN